MVGLSLHARMRQKEDIELSVVCGVCEKTLPRSSVLFFSSTRKCPRLMLLGSRMKTLDLSLQGIDLRRKKCKNKRLGKDEICIRDVRFSLSPKSHPRCDMSRDLQRTITNDRQTQDNNGRSQMIMDHSQGHLPNVLLLDTRRPRPSHRRLHFARPGTTTMGTSTRPYHQAQLRAWVSTRGLVPDPVTTCATSGVAFLCAVSGQRIEFSVLDCHSLARQSLYSTFGAWYTDYQTPVFDLHSHIH